MRSVYPINLGSMYMSMRFNFNNKYKQRRLSSNNFYSFGKSSCRVAVTPRTLWFPSYPFLSKTRESFSSCSAKAKKASAKIHFRSFRSRRSCWNFKQELKAKFNSLSDKKLTIRTNIRGTKIQYFYGAKI